MIHDKEIFNKCIETLFVQYGWGLSFKDFKEKCTNFVENDKTAQEQRGVTSQIGVLMEYLNSYPLL